MSSPVSPPCTRECLRVPMRVSSDATDGRALQASRKDLPSRGDGMTYYIHGPSSPIFRLASRIDLVVNGKSGVVPGMLTRASKTICGIVVSGTTVPGLAAISVCFGSISLSTAPTFSISSTVTTILFLETPFLVRTQSALAHGQVVSFLRQASERNSKSPHRLTHRQRRMPRYSSRTVTSSSAELVGSTFRGSCVSIVFNDMIPRGSDTAATRDVYRLSLKENGILE